MEDSQIKVEQKNYIYVTPEEIIFDVNSELLKKKYQSEEIVKVNATLLIKNLHEKDIFMKINTNKQNLYISSPSRKILKPNEKVIIDIVFNLKYKNLKKEITDNHKFQIVAYEVEEENEQNINESQISELIKTNNKNPNEIKKIKAKFIYDENILKKEELKQKKNKPEDLNPTESDKNKIKSLKIEIIENQTKYKDLKFEFSQLEAKIKELSKNQILSIKLELNKDKLEHVEKIPGFLVAFLCFIAFLFGYFLTS